MKAFFSNEWVIAIGSVIAGCFFTIVVLIPLYEKAKAEVSK